MSKRLSENEIQVLLSEVLSDNNLELLINAMFGKDNSIDKILIINALQQMTSQKYGKKYNSYFDFLRTSQDELDYFLFTMSKWIWIELFPGTLNWADAISIDELTVWLMYAVAIKKCLGSAYSKAKISDIQYYSKMTETINTEQKKAHDQCISGFCLNSNCFSLKKDPYLGVFLHRIHSKNKTKKTQKKNIRRVIKRANKFVLLNRLEYRGESIFNNGKHLVPKQFGEAIIGIFLN